MLQRLFYYGGLKNTTARGTASKIVKVHPPLFGLLGHNGQVAGPDCDHPVIIDAVISGEIPPGRELYAEYIRAFAHCIEFDQVCEILGRGPDAEGIPLGDIEGFYQMYGGQGGWGWLDKEERQWMANFNQKLRGARSVEKRVEAIPTQVPKHNKRRPL